jgi:hypothetical protein
MTKLAPLTFEKALAWLLGLMGEAVEVTLFSEEPYGPVASIRGKLTTGGEIERPVYRARDEAFIFRLEGGAAGSFVLERRMLRRACVVVRTDERPDSLRFYLGASTILQIDIQEAAAA